MLRPMFCRSRILPARCYTSKTSHRPAEHTETSQRPAKTRRDFGSFLPAHANKPSVPDDNDTSRPLPLQPA